MYLENDKWIINKRKESVENQDEKKKNPFIYLYCRIEWHLWKWKNQSKWFDIRILSIWLIWKNEILIQMKVKSNEMNNNKKS